MPLMTSQQAADRIGVSVRHVQRLVVGGDLVAIGHDRIDGESVAQWLAQRQGSRLRAWEEPTAWAAVALLEGGAAPWLGQSQRSRLRAALAEVTGAELAARARNRAEVHRYPAHPKALDRLARDVIGSGATGGIGGLTAASDRLDGYLEESILGKPAGAGGRVGREAFAAVRAGRDPADRPSGGAAGNLDGQRRQRPVKRDRFRGHLALPTR